MIFRNSISTSILAVFLILIISCAGGNSNNGSGVIPDSETPALERISQESTPGHQLWAYHLIYINPEEEKYEIIPSRDISAHWNILGFLEQVACSKCVEIAGLSVTPDLTLLIDLKIIHPFPTANLTGFDVRGIMMFNGSRVYPVSGLTGSDNSVGDCELLNADGFTTLYNASTAGSGPGGLQGYIEGRLASFTPPDAELNGFRKYVTDNPANTRNAFYSGDEITVGFEIDPPDGDFVFGYAVDASWAPPMTKPVTDPMTQFPPGANCAEPWKVKAIDTPVGDGLTKYGGQTEMTIRVDDYQGRESHAVPVIECWDLFTGSITATFKEDGDGFSRWTVMVENENLAGSGEYKCLIAVEDNENDPINSPWLDLTAYYIHTLVVANGCIDNLPPVAVAETHPDPAVIFPGEEVCFNDLSTDPDGSADIVKWEWDFSYESGDGFQSESEVQNPWYEYSEEGEFEVQLRVTDSCSNTDMLDTPLTVSVAQSGWARTWGGSETDVGYGVVTDSSGNIYVTGDFWIGMDFDPGPATDWHDSNGDRDVFLCKYDSTGRFLWVQTWGGTGIDYGLRVAVDSSDCVYVAGVYSETVDFDPGEGVDEHISNGGTWEGDCFVSKFDSAGNYLWACTWGGDRDDHPYGLAIDSSDNIYTTGNFWGTVDFDPGPGVDEQSPVMNDGIFISKLGTAGVFHWAVTIGGTYSDYAHGIAVDGNDDIYITGKFGLTVDFDPGPGEAECTSSSWWDAYLAKYDSTGAFQWVQAWGGLEAEEGNGITVDNGNNVYVSGYFNTSVDFDPGPGMDLHDTNGSRDVYVCKYDSSGNYQWTRTWGGTSWDEPYGITSDAYNNIHVSGYFSDVCDFDPGTGTTELISNGNEDVFVSRLSPDGTLQWVRGFGGTGGEFCGGVAAGPFDNIYVTGCFNETDVDFDPGGEEDLHSAVGMADIFVVKFLPNGYWEW